MAEISNISLEKARFEPEAVFSPPQDIVSEAGLTRGQKLAALSRWRQTLTDRIRATEEGMAPPAGQTAFEAATIEEIMDAEAQLAEPAPV